MAEHDAHAPSGFTLIELLVVIAIIAILAVVVVLTLNPAELLRQSRDSNRVSDMDTLNSALSLYSTDQSAAPSFSLGSSSVVYVSIPDPAATSTAGTNCASLGLPALPVTYSYHCAASSTYRNANGTGWIPVNLAAISSGDPLSNLPVDPTNQSSSRLYYTYTTNGAQFEVTAAMESAKYGLGGSNDQISGDGGSLASVYEKGSRLGLEPLDYGDPTLAGYWPLDEGSGGIAYDDSGTNATGTWYGSTPYYTTGKIGPYAGSFNGANDYVNMGNPTALQSTNALTVSAWINPSVTTSWLRIVSNSWQSGSLGGVIDLSTGGSSNVFCFIKTTSGSPSISSPSNSISAGSWAHVVCEYSGSSLSLYINGVLVNQTLVGGTLSYSNGYPWAIGAEMGTSTPAEFFNGAIDDVRIYGRALSASEVAAMYNGGK